MDFKFAVGDTVRHKLTKLRMFIIERHAQECSGGVQRIYLGRCSTSGRELLIEAVRFNETELEAVPEPRAAAELLEEAKQAFLHEKDFEAASAVRQVMAEFCKPAEGSAG